MKYNFFSLLRRVKLVLNPIKVSFIVVGAKKSGTSALYSFLNKHPELSLGKIKETDFFSKENFWRSGENYKLYHNFFQAHWRKVKYGEASPSYMRKHRIVAPRIAKYNPNIKLIFILRNPVERAFSEYKMHVNLHNLKLSFSECLQIALDKDTSGIELDKNNWVTRNGSTNMIKSYIRYGRYAEQIRTYKKIFKPNQLLFLLNEDLLEKHDETMRIIYEFLDVAYLNIEREIIFSHKVKSEIDDIEKKILLAEYAEEIEELEIILNRDLSHWKTI